MKESFLVAAVQMVSGSDVNSNLQCAAHWVSAAARLGARLTVLPEYCCLIGQEDTDQVAVCETYGDGPIQRELAIIALQNRMWLAAGTIPLRSSKEGRILNTTVLFDPNGEVRAAYHKIHLFSFSGLGESHCEANTTCPGDLPLKVDLGFAEVAFGICYDLRFPELFRQLLPYDLVILPAAFSVTTGRAHWEPLLRARAIENQCYVLASAQGGTHDCGRKTYGHSMIIDPWGRVLSEIETGEGVILAEIDPRLIRSVRNCLPVLAHRVFV